MKRSEILEAARRCVCGEREQDSTAHLKTTLKPSDCSGVFTSERPTLKSDCPSTALRPKTLAR